MTRRQSLLMIKPITIGLATVLFSSAMAQTSPAPSNVVPAPPIAITAPTNTGNPVPPAPTTFPAQATPAKPAIASPTPTMTTNSTNVPPMLNTTPATNPTTQTSAQSVTFVPLTQPNLSDDDLINWATDAAQLAYMYDFKNYPRQIPMSQQNFTIPGWKAFNTALEKSNNLKVVESKKLVASAAPTAKAVIVEKGAKNGIYIWKVQIPMLATYESESRRIKQNLLVTLLISRMNAGKGLGISHFIATITPTPPQPIPQSVPATIGTPASVNTQNTGAQVTTSPPMMNGPNPAPSNGSTAPTVITAPGATTTITTPTQPMPNQNSVSPTPPPATNGFTNTPAPPTSVTMPARPADAGSTNPGASTINPNTIAPNTGNPTGFNPGTSGSGRNSTY